jgi:energy-converting hydrogenase Eha subunit C
MALTKKKKKELIRRLTDKGNLMLIAVQILGLLTSYGVIDVAAAHTHEEAIGTILFILATAGIVRETKKDEGDSK